MLTPHHDGSPLDVSTQAPALGETVRVRLRVPDTFGPLEWVGTRSNPNREPRFCEAVRRRGRRRLAVVGGARRGREPGARLPVAARRRGRPAALAEPARALAGRDARPRRLQARRARARARVGGGERVVPGVPRPVREVGWRRLRPAQGEDELPEWAIPADWSDPVDDAPPGRRRSSTAATSTACESTSTTSSGSA